MLDKDTIAGAGANMPEEQTPSGASVSEAEKKAEDVAQKKLDALAYAENYRQKLRAEKAQRQSPAMRKAEQQRLENKEREREERRRKMEEMLHAERSTLEQRSARADEVLQAVSDAEEERRQDVEENITPKEPQNVSEPPAAALKETAPAAEPQSEPVATPAPAAEPQPESVAAPAPAVAAKKQPLPMPKVVSAPASPSKQESDALQQPQKEVTAETADTIENTEKTDDIQTPSAEETKVAEYAEGEAQHAEEQAEQEAAEQVRKIVEAVEAERAAEQEAAETARVAAELAAEDRSHAEVAAEEIVRASKQQPSEENESDDSEDLSEEEIAARRRMLYTEAEEEAQKRKDAALQNAHRVVAHPVKKAPAAHGLSDEDLRAKRALARQLAADRLRAKNAGSADENAPAVVADVPETQAQTDTDAAAQTPTVTEDVSVVCVPVAPAYADKESYDEAAKSAQEAVKETRLAEKAAKNGELTETTPLDFEARRRNIAPAVYQPMPAEEALPTSALDAAAVIAEEKQYAKNARRTKKKAKTVLPKKKGLHIHVKVVERSLKRETEKAAARDLAMQKKTDKAEKRLASAERKEQKADARVLRSQKKIERLTAKQTAMEIAHAKKLAKKPRSASALYAREEALARDILQAHNAVERVARVQEKAAHKSLKARAEFDSALSRQEKKQRKTDRRVQRFSRAHGKAVQKQEAYDRKADRKLSKIAGAADHTAARANVTFRKGDIPRALHAASARQLRYEKARLKDGRATRKTAEMTLRAQNRTVKPVTRAQRSLTQMQGVQGKHEKNVAALQNKVDRLIEKQQRLEERNRRLVESKPSAAFALAKQERAMARRIREAQKELFAARHDKDTFERKHVDTAQKALLRAEQRQTKLYGAHSKILGTAKARSDMWGLRAERHRVERRNLEEDYRVLREHRAVDAAELAALESRKKNNSRKMRTLKRRAKEAQAQERAAMTRAERDTRAWEKALAVHAVQNYRSEHTLARNPAAYGRVIKETQKRERRLEKMENGVVRSERLLEKATARREKAMEKMQTAMGSQQDNTAEISAYYDRTVSRPYVAKDRRLKNDLLREKKKSVARAEKEARAYERDKRLEGSKTYQSRISDDRDAALAAAGISVAATSLAASHRKNASETTRRKGKDTVSYQSYPAATQTPTLAGNTTETPTRLTAKDRRRLKKQEKQNRAMQKRRGKSAGVNTQTVSSRENVFVPVPSFTSSSLPPYETAKSGVSRREYARMRKENARLAEQARRDAVLARKAEKAQRKGVKEQQTYVPAYDAPMASSASYPSYESSLAMSGERPLSRREYARMCKEDKRLAEKARREEMLARKAEKAQRKNAKGRKGKADARYQEQWNDSRLSRGSATEADARSIEALQQQEKKARVALRVAENAMLQSRRDLQDAVKEQDTMARKRDRILQKNPAKGRRMVQQDEKYQRRVDAAEVQLNRCEARYEKALAKVQAIEREMNALLGRRSTTESYMPGERRRGEPSRSVDVMSQAAYDASETPLTGKAAKADKADRRSLRTLDALRRKRYETERKVMRTSKPSDLFNLVVVQKDICNELFVMLRRQVSVKNITAQQTADTACTEIRLYNTYVSRLGEQTGNAYPLAEQTLPYDILNKRRYAPIASIKYKGIRRSGKADRAMRASSLDERRYAVTSKVSPAMSRREFSAYTKGILQTNDDISKRIANIRKQNKTSGKQMMLRVQAEILCLQKEILENDIHLFTMARELRYAGAVKKLIGGAKRHVKEYNRDVKRLETLDKSRHARVEPNLPVLVLEGRDYREIPNVVCLAPGSKTPLDRFAPGDNYSEVDKAVVESRFNRRIAALTNEMRDGKFSHVLYEGRARHDRRTTKKKIADLQAERKVALAMEAHDNSRYGKLMNFAPGNKKRFGRRINNRAMLDLQGKLAMLLSRRDDLNRELLQLYAMRTDETKVTVTEQYADGTLGIKKLPRTKRGSDAPYVVKESGALQKGRKSVYSPDMEYEMVLTKARRSAYKKTKKKIKAIRRLGLPKSHPDVRNLYDLYNRRVELTATIETASKKIRIYGYKGKAAADIKKEKQQAIKAVRRIDKEITARTKHAKRAHYAVARPFWVG